MSDIFVISPFPGREMCDFCSEAPTTQIYACKNFLIPRTKTATFQHESIGGWTACTKCAELIDGRRWAELTDRARAVPRDPSAVQGTLGHGELKCKFATTGEK